MAASMVYRNLIRNFSNASVIQKCIRTPGMLSDTLIPKQLGYVRTITCQSCLMSDKTLPAPELKKLMESLTDKFVEARELMDDARESEGTVYFSDDIEEAQDAVNETLKEYKELLNQLSDSQRQQVVSTLGLRMEELKAQQAAIEESLKD